jgi:hypothetical protein
MELAIRNILPKVIRKVIDARPYTSLNGKASGFTGEMACGFTNRLIYEESLQKPNGFISQMGYGKYLEDHVYLMEDNIIYDPTWKQFLLQGNQTPIVEHIIFSEDTLFVGTRNDIQCHMTNLMNQINHEDKTNYDFKQISHFWEDPMPFNLVRL